MSHPSDELWLDYARGAITEETRDRLRHHLERGCTKCQATLQLWEDVLRTASSDRGAYTPDEDVVRAAKGAFSRLRSGKSRMESRAADCLGNVFSTACHAIAGNLLL